MGKMKDIVMTIEELIVQGYDEVEIARMLDLPVDMVDAVYDDFVEAEQMKAEPEYGDM
jgi:hypothetical protein